MGQFYGRPADDFTTLVGKFRKREEAVQTMKKLSRKGYKDLWIEEQRGPDTGRITRYVLYWKGIR